VAGRAAAARARHPYKNGHQSVAQAGWVNLARDASMERRARAILGSAKAGRAGGSAGCWALASASRAGSVVIWVSLRRFCWGPELPPIMFIIGGNGATAIEAKWLSRLRRRLP